MGGPIWIITKNGKGLYFKRFLSVEIWQLLALFNCFRNVYVHSASNFKLFCFWIGVRVGRVNCIHTFVNIVIFSIYKAAARIIILTVQHQAAGYQHISKEKDRTTSKYACRVFPTQPWGWQQATLYSQPPGSMTCVTISTWGDRLHTCNAPEWGLWWAGPPPLKHGSSILIVTRAVNRFASKRAVLRGLYQGDDTGLVLFSLV